jgi:sulfate adenylyltransferase subunit 1 (EFTu-like GTPase family)
MDFDTTLFLMMEAGREKVFVVNDDDEYKALQGKLDAAAKAKGKRVTLTRVGKKKAIATISSAGDDARAAAKASQIASGLGI